MQPSKLQLENYFVEEVFFNLQSSNIRDLDTIPKLDASDLDIEVRLGENKDDENERYCQLTVNLKEKKTATFPYKFKIVMAGFYELDSSCSETDADLLMTNTAPSMLYTAAREYLLLITGRTRFFPVMLPTVLFVPKKKRSKAEPKVKTSNGKKVSAGKSKAKGRTKGKN